MKFDLKYDPAITYYRLQWYSIDVFHILDLIVKL